MKQRVVLIGPHGAGKTTLARALVAAEPQPLKYELEQLVTSRPRRLNEDDLEYAFVSQRQFDENRQDYAYIQLNRGVSWNYALRADHPVAPSTVRLYVVIPETAVYLRNSFPQDTIVIGVVPPSSEALRQRLQERDPTASQAELDVRLRYLDYDIEQAYQLADAVFCNQASITEAADALRATIEKLVQE